MVVKCYVWYGYFGIDFFDYFEFIFRLQNIIIDYQLIEIIFKFKMFDILVGKNVDSKNIVNVI